MEASQALGDEELDMTLAAEVLEALREASKPVSSDKHHIHHQHHRALEAADDDDDESVSSGSSDGDVDDEEKKEEGEEDSDEEDEEEEQEEVEEEGTEEEQDGGKTLEEIEAELREKQTLLINDYILAKGRLKYERKRNAYFQDRIYRTSVRKGIIIESELASETTLVKKKARRCLPLARMDEDGEEDDQSTGQHSEEAEVKKKRKRRHRHRRSNEEEEEGQWGGRRGFIGENFANQAKYNKLIRKIMKIQRMKGQYLFQHQAALDAHADKCRAWSELHVDFMNKLLDEIRFHSEFAVDSHTGKRLPKHETEEYCAEVSRIHLKLCDTMLKMYKSRRGLEFTLKRLKESEIQEGEEIEILEYEQLKDENSTLKDKLGDRIKDVENAKSKISYAIQILAHVRSKMGSMTDRIGDGEDNLNAINQEVYAVKNQTEEVMKYLIERRKEERALVVDSGLLDNSALLRDYEETSERVADLREEKKQLERKMVEGNRELGEMKDRTQELMNHYPGLAMEASGGKASRTGLNPKATPNRKCDDKDQLDYICKPPAKSLPN